MTATHATGAAPVPIGIDLTIPSPARMYDYYLGGALNFGVDRAAARRVIEAWPPVVSTARNSRAFGRRAVAHMLGAGIDQFLDLGCGIPGPGSTHDIVRRLGSDAAVVYTDIDPVASAHAEVSLAGTSRVAMIRTDLREPAELIATAEFRRLIDLTRPIGILMLGVLHFLADEDDPRGAVADYQARCAAGSALALWHSTPLAEQTDESTARCTVVDQTYAATGNALTLRRPREVAALLGDWPIEAPGLVPPHAWHPDVATASDSVGVAGVAWKR